MDRMTDDGIEVAEYLRAHLHQDKILLVGHSWGTILGVHMVKKRPFLFSAYVGTGQFVNPEENEKFLYAHVLAAAKAAKNEPALTAVEDLGRLSYRDGRRIAGVRDWADRLDRGLGDPVKPFVTRAAPGLPAEYYPAMGRAMLFSRQQLGRVIGSSDADLPSLGPDFELPVFFFEGTADQMTPLEPAQAYFELIRAPHKEFVRFEGDHHFVAMNRPEEFLRELLARVRPWTVPAP
jgi:pimeloyl-ACP methyl ester carboxylesterase